MGKEKKKRKGHPQAVRKHQKRLDRIRRKKERKVQRRKQEWTDNGWDVQYPELFKEKFLMVRGNERR